MEQRGDNQRRGSVLRCFVGARVAPASRRLLRTTLEQVLPAPERPRGRLVPVENLHLTLKFLGATPKADVPALLRQVRALEPHALTVPVTRIVGLPRPARARNLVAELARHPQLLAWRARLEAALGAEDRFFRPHVTLERLRRPGTVAPVTLEAPLEIELEPPTLYRSEPAEDGVRYHPLG
ncbi:MAG: RNA 2',3'-cyclic phosphodiesterase [Pseudomonadota bacterium]